MGLAVPSNGLVHATTRITPANLACTMCSLVRIEGRGAPA